MNGRPEPGINSQIGDAFFKQIAYSTTLDEVLEHILDEVRYRWGFESFAVQLVDASGRFLTLYKSWGHDELAHDDFSVVSQRVSIDENESISARVLNGRSAFYAQDMPSKDWGNIPRIDAQALRIWGIVDNLIVPVVDEGRALGVIHLFTTSRSLALPRSVIHEISDFISALARIIRTEKDREDIEYLNRQYREIGASIEIQNILTKMLNAIDQIVQAECGVMVNLYEREQKALVCEGIRLPDKLKVMEDTYKGLRFPLADNDIQIEAFQKKVMECITRETTHICSETLRLRFERWEAESLTILPIILGDGESIGTVLLFQHLCDDALKRQAILDVISIYAPLIHNAWTFHTLKKREEQIRDLEIEKSIFLNFVFKVNALTSPEEIVNNFAEEVFRNYPFNILNVMIPVGDYLMAKYGAASHQEFGLKLEWFLNEFGERGFRLAADAGAPSYVYLSDEPLYIQDVTSIMHLPMAPADQKALGIYENIGTILALPIHFKEEVVGVIYLFTLGDQILLSAQDRSYLQQLSDFLGSALSNARLYETIERQKTEITVLNAQLRQSIEELHIMATTDKLTKLKNFSYMQDELRRRIHDLHRDKTSQLSILIIDLDHFKRFNDQYGHQGGNVALEQAAKCLLEIVRDVDTPCRYGGEEFVVVLPKCPLENAIEVAERIREKIMGMQILIGDEVVSITTSIGVASYHQGESVDDLIERADQALYVAKQNGRNRVEVAR